VECKKKGRIGIEGGCSKLVVSAQQCKSVRMESPCGSGHVTCI
jgi:hypothetical protein